MSTLTIDTSTVSVIALVGDTSIVRRSVDARHHTETLAPLVEEIVAEGGKPDLIVAGTGPAAFTGLRAGLVTARALARAWHVPIVGVSSLEILGRAALDEAPDPVIAVGDARRKEVYAAKMIALGTDDVELIWGPEVLSPHDLAQRAPGARFIGAGAALYREILVGGIDMPIDPFVMERLARARRTRADAGEHVDVGTAPRYLRRPDIHGQ